MGITTSNTVLLTLSFQIKKKDKLLSENVEANARLQTSMSEKEMEKEATEAKMAALEAERTRLLEVSYL